MNMDLETLTKWLEGYKRGETQNNIVIAPSFIHIPLVMEFAKKVAIELAAQDIAAHDKGAHTGDIGAFQVKQFCKYAIVGHSERAEPLEIVLKKRDICINQGITPIVCVTSPEVAAKLYTPQTLLAWEDPNNISVNGQYREKNPAEILEGAKLISAQLPEGAKFIYGGSVNRQNIADLAKISELNGVLVGNASLDPQHFADIISAYV